MGVLLFATRPKLCNCLHPVDVGAANDRPRAIGESPLL